jgi:multiple sugar transport system permease protein
VTGHNGKVVAAMSSASPGAVATRPRVRRRGLSLRAREELAGYAFISFWIIGFVVFTLGAMLASLVLTGFKTDLMTGYRFAGAKNFAGLFSDKLFRKALGVTSVYTFSSVPLRLVFALAIAMLLNQRLPVLGLWRLLYYVPSVVSGVAVAVLWSWMFQPKFGLINSFLKTLGIKGPLWLISEEWALPAIVIMSLWGVGGGMLIYLAGLQSIPTHLYEAAKIDGAGILHQFWHITLPMLSPTIFFNLIMNIIGSYQVFGASYIMTQGGPNNATLTVVLLLYRVAFEQFRFGYASAMAWALFLIILVFTLLVIRSSQAWVYYEGEVRS